MSKLIIATVVLIIAILGGVILLISPENNPLYSTVTHLALSYESSPTYGSSLSDCNWTVTCSAYSEKISPWTRITYNQPVYKNYSYTENKLWNFTKYFVNQYNMTFAMALRIYNNATGELLLERTMSFEDMFDKEVHIYADPNIITPCTYIRIVVDIYFSINYTLKGDVSGLPTLFTKEIHKERVIHVETTSTPVPQELS